MIELPPHMVVFLVTAVGVLLVLLIVSFTSRARVFTEYLRLMTGIRLSPREVGRVFRQRGRPGVREMFLELIIREDLRDSPPITPDTPPSRSPLSTEKPS